MSVYNPGETGLGGGSGDADGHSAAFAQSSFQPPRCKRARAEWPSPVHPPEWGWPPECCDGRCPCGKSGSRAPERREEPQALRDVQGHSGMACRDYLTFNAQAMEREASHGIAAWLLPFICQVTQRNASGGCMSCQLPWQWRDCLS